jgi:subtilisin family serine protease
MKNLIITFALMFSITGFAQHQVDKISNNLDVVLNNTAENEEVHIWVFFTDKGNNLTEYFNNPTTVVSEKSLQRRAKVLDKNSLISFTDLPVNENYVNELQNSGFKVKHRTKWFNGVSGWATKQVIEELTNLSYVQEMDIVHKYKTDYSVEEEESENTSLNNENLSKPGSINSFNYGDSFTQLNQITVPAVHDLGYTGQGITICSMDAGFDNLAHEVFSSMNIIAMWDFVDNDPDVSQGGSHGTSTLSTLGGFKEGQLIGPAFGSDFILARTEDIYSETPIEEDNWIAAVEWADSIGVDVTSTSLSYLDYDPPHTSYTWEDMDGNTARITIAADLAVKWGIFVVNSASNSGYHPDHNTLGAPADGDSVITVGAVDGSGARASFSSVGPTVDGRIKPDLMAMGSGVYVARSSSPTSYGYSGGTSFSCPILAGASALILSVDPTLTPMELLDLLRQTASQSANPDRLMGWGIINTLDVVNSLNPTIVENEVPDNFYILRNYPNPFNPSTKVQFSVPQQSDVKITLHDMLGRELELLFNDKVDAGMQEFVVDAGNLASGVYLIRMIAGSSNKTIKISLIK